MKTEHKYYTISAPDPRYTSNGWTVYGWGTYPRSSVLAGQPRKCFIKSYDTLELAQAAYPKANQSSKWIDRWVRSLRRQRERRWELQRRRELLMMIGARSY